MIDFSALLVPFAFGLVLEVFFEIGRYRRKRDIIEYFKRFLSRHKANSALKDLINVKEGLQKYYLTEGWPFYFPFFKKPTYDLEAFNEIVEEAIEESQKAVDVKQIKQKIAISETRVEDIILRSYKYNINQPGFYLFMVSKFVFGYAIINLLLNFFNSLSNLLTF